MKYTIDKQEKYSLLRLHEEKLDSSVAPNLKSELITLHAEGVRNIIAVASNPADGVYVVDHPDL